MRRPCADCEEKRVTYGDDEPDDDADQEQLDLDNPNQRGLSYQLREPRGSRSSGHIARAMREESGSAVGWDDTRWKVIRRRRSALASPRNATASPRSEEHTSELQSLMRISYAVFCLKKKNYRPKTIYTASTSQNTSSPQLN